MVNKPYKRNPNASSMLPHISDYKLAEGFNGAGCQFGIKEAFKKTSRFCWCLV